MLVYKSQADALLKEFGDDGVPGYNHLKAKVTTVDAKNDIAELELVDAPHSSVQAFAAAAGIVEASTPQPEIKNLALPVIIGFPNVGQYIETDGGVWETRELGPNDIDAQHTLRWLYDGDEETPVTQREDNGHGPQSINIPADALGKKIVVRVTQGATTVLSKPFGPVEEGLTDYPYEERQPVLDTDIVKAESRKTEAKKSPAQKRASSTRKRSTKSRAAVPRKAS